ncbi:MAG: GyrI-like domain-containing protein [Anaerolineales bacterium]|nr:GyrI-like domain-containing protein [Anaerolineales bacterium]
MSIDVQFVKLPALKVASALGFGEQPETEAWRKIFAWMEANNLLGDIKARRFFGFNNPNPSPGSPNYGYEQWVTVPQGMQAEGDVKIVDFPGGYYATIECKLLDIGEKWGELVNWQAGSKYRMAPNQCLEECLTPEILIDAPEDQPFSIENVGKMQMRLYLPIVEGE